ncbi:MAG: APC family permease [Clostridiales Family XIII bacterium]|jgi:amino acid transporter|nr:APC family permease [Clostridiales Family XIII bacterium]
MREDKDSLKRVLGRVEIFALAFGTMVGWGWVMLAGEWVRLAGAAGSILVFAAVAAMCVAVGLIYAELTSAFPLAGGELAFSYRGMGYAGSWITGWTVSLAYISVASWESIGLSIALHHLFPIAKAGYLWNIAGFDIYLSWSAAGMAGAVLLTVLNIIGVKQVAVFQMFSILLLTVAGLIYAFGGFAFGRLSYAAPAFTDAAGMGTVLLMVPSMYIGFDMVAKSAEEMNIPLKHIAKVLVFSIVAAGAWYVIILFGTAIGAPADAVVPPAGASADAVPVADLAAYMYRSDIFAKLMICGGIFGIATSWNGFILGASRILFAMGRAGMLPSVFGVLHPRYRTPAASIAFVGLICCVSPLMGAHSLIWLVDVAAFGTVLTYLLISLSYLMIRKNEPDLRRHYKIKRGRATGAAVVAGSAFFLLCCTPFSPIARGRFEEWRIILAWALLGVLLAVLRPRGHTDPISAPRAHRNFFSDRSE